MDDVRNLKLQKKWVKRFLRRRRIVVAKRNQIIRKFKLKKKALKGEKKKITDLLTLKESELLGVGEEMDKHSDSYIENKQLRKDLAKITRKLKHLRNQQYKLQSVRYNNRKISKLQTDIAKLRKKRDWLKKGSSVISTKLEI